jgi:hypothetical protein
MDGEVVEVEVEVVAADLQILGHEDCYCMG